jgi:hypothetical protein
MDNKSTDESVHRNSAMFFFKSSDFIRKKNSRAKNWKIREMGQHYNQFVA